MLDIKFLRNNPDIVKENIKKKFQDQKLVMVDEVIALDKEYRDSKTRADYLRSQRNSISRQIGALMAKGQKTTYEQVLKDVQQRDYQDTHREIAPLKQADDAVLVDSSDLDIDGVVAAIKAVAAEKIPV